MAEAYLKQHKIEAFIQDMVEDLKNKPSNPYAAMAAYVRKNKSVAEEDAGDAAFSGTTKFLTPKSLSGDKAVEYTAAEEEAGSYSAANAGMISATQPPNTLDAPPVSAADAKRAQVFPPVTVWQGAPSGRCTAPAARRLYGVGGCAGGGQCARGACSQSGPGELVRREPRRANLLPSDGQGPAAGLVLQRLGPRL